MTIERPGYNALLAEVIRLRAKLARIDDAVKYEPDNMRCRVAVAAILEDV